MRSAVGAARRTASRTSRGRRRRHELAVGARAELDREARVVVVGSCHRDRLPPPDRPPPRRKSCRCEQLPDSCGRTSQAGDRPGGKSCRCEQLRDSSGRTSCGGAGGSTARRAPGSEGGRPLTWPHQHRARAPGRRGPHRGQCAVLRGRVRLHRRRPHPRVADGARRGNRRARVLERMLPRLNFYLSGAQLGITITSIGLGFVAQPYIAAVLSPLLENVFSPRTADGVALVIALPWPRSCSSCSPRSYPRTSPSAGRRRPAWPWLRRCACSAPCSAR